jgi:cytochrome P450
MSLHRAECPGQEGATSPESGPHALAFPLSPVSGLGCCPEYRELRTTEPVCRIQLPYGGQAWLVTSYAEAATVLSAPGFSRAATAGRELPRETPEQQSRSSLQALDPPEHTRVRNLAARALTPRRIAALRPHVERHSAELLAAMQAGGPPADLISSYARLLPVRLISELRGIPASDQDKLLTWSDATSADTTIPLERRQQLAAELTDYVNALIAERRATPGNDLISALITARDGGQHLTEQELVELTTIVLVGGNDTTSNQLGNFAFVLLTHPRQLEALRENPALIPAAVEELVRFIPFGASTMLPRVAIRSAVLGGQRISPGDVLFIANESANRDERVFGDGERLDFGRATNPHLGFGHGPHYCLGAHQARLQLQVAVQHWLELLPGLRLAVPPEQIEWRNDQIVRGPAALPVTW